MNFYQTLSDMRTGDSNIFADVDKKNENIKLEQYVETFKHKLEAAKYDLMAPGKTNVDLYKNPTPKEFRELVKERKINQKDSFRFVVTYAGDIYTIGSMTDKSALIFHEDILNMMRNRKIMNPTKRWAENLKSLKSFGCFTYHREDGGFFTFAESYDGDDLIEFISKNKGIAKHYKKVIQSKLANREFIMGTSTFYREH